MVEYKPYQFARSYSKAVQSTLEEAFWQFETLSSNMEVWFESDELLQDFIFSIADRNTPNDETELLEAARDIYYSECYDELPEDISPFMSNGKFSLIQYLQLGYYYLIETEMQQNFDTLVFNLLARFVNRQGKTGDVVDTEFIENFMLGCDLEQCIQTFVKDFIHAMVVGRRPKATKA